MTKFLLFLFAIIPSLASTQTNAKNRKQGELVIQGTVSHLKEPVQYVYIISLDGIEDGFDSARVINDKYNFKIQTGATTLVTLYAKTPANFPGSYEDRYMLTLILEPTTVMISSTDSFSNAKVSGSVVYPGYEKMEKEREPYSMQVRKLLTLQSQQKETGDKDGMAQTEYAIDSTLDALYTHVYYKYVKTNPSSLLTNYALNNYVESLKNDASTKDLEEIELVYNTLSEVDKASYFGRETRKKIDSYKIHIGMVAPEIVQTDIAGNSISLNLYKGKYVLLDFWASWCGPCRADYPAMKELYKKYNNKGLEIIAISKDEDSLAFRKAIIQDGTDLWINILGNEKVLNSYFVSTIPLKILIDPKGVVIGIWREGGEDNFKSLKKSLEQNIETKL